MKIQHFWQGVDSGAEDIFNKKGVLWPCQNVHQSIVSEMNQNFCSCMNVSWSNLLLVDKTVHIWSIYDTYHLHKSMKLEVLEATCYVIHLYHLIRKRRLYCLCNSSRGVVETRGGIGAEPYIGAWQPWTLLLCGCWGSPMNLRPH